MRYSAHQVVFQEIPNEISLAFHVTGCPLRCAGCHSSDLWSSGTGEILDLQNLKKNIEKFRPFITCVLFLGGEWAADELIEHLDTVRSFNLKTALYTGLEIEQVDPEITGRLDYLKYGKYIAARGALSSSQTNQKIINLKTNENLNHYFTQGGLAYDSIRRQTS